MAYPPLLPIIGRGFFSAIIFILTSLHSVEAGGAGGPLDVRQLLGHQALDQDLWQDHREYMIVDKTPEQIRKTFYIEDDLTAELKGQIVQENSVLKKCTR